MWWKAESSIWDLPLSYVTLSVWSFIFHWGSLTCCSLSGLYFDAQAMVRLTNGNQLLCRPDLLPVQCPCGCRWNTEVPFEGVKTNKMMGFEEKMSWVKLRGKYFHLVSQINGTLHYSRSASVLFLEVMLSDSLLYIVWCHGEKRFITIHGLRNLDALMCPIFSWCSHETNNFFFSKLKLIFVTAQVLVWCWILFVWLVCFGGLLSV